MADISKIQTTGGVYSLCDTVARANKGCGYAYDEIKFDTKSTNICPTAVTPNVDGYILVIIVTSATWGFDGKAATLRTTCSDSNLNELSYQEGSTGTGGNQIGRQMFGVSLWGPCQAGRLYTFSSDLKGATLGSSAYINTFCFVI